MIWAVKLGLTENIVKMFGYITPYQKKILYLHARNKKLRNIDMVIGIKSIKESTYTNVWLNIKRRDDL